MAGLVDLSSLCAGSYFYACIRPGDLDLWCRVGKRERNTLTVEVINGAYTAIFDSLTGALSHIVGVKPEDETPPCRIAFTGALPPEIARHDYNSAIHYAIGALRSTESNQTRLADTNTPAPTEDPSSGAVGESPSP
jgi:hypothetical protein